MPLRYILPALLVCTAVHAQFTHLDRWFLVEDPPHPGLNASISGTGAASSATLTAANVAIPSGTDIGYKAFNGNLADDATAGYYFDPANDFSIAIDYDLSISGTELGIGFGVGEDGNGENSAGIVLLRTVNSGFTVIGIGAASRTNDIDDTPVALGLASTGTTDDGSLFVTYTASTGTISVGRSASPGAATPGTTHDFTGYQNGWNDRGMLVSFFLRSQGSTGGTATAVFDNLRVLSGTPTGIAPKVSSVTKNGDDLEFTFFGGSGWNYFIEGGSNLSSFPDDLTDAPGTTITETPADSGIFTGAVDVSGKGPSYFLRFTDQDPTP